MTYQKAGAISFAVSQSTRSRAGQAAHHRAMKRYEQPIKMAPHVNAGLIGKAQAPHIERRGYQNPIKIALRLAAERQGPAGARLIIFKHRNQWRDHG
jgi:hypothetical protein